MKIRSLRRAGVVALAVALMLPVGVASAHDGHETPLPGTPPAKTVGFDVLGQANPGTGTNADVYAFEGFAYLGSWVGKGCQSKGIRVYDLDDPQHPTQVSTFADAASDPTLAGTWTEKVIVQQVHTRSFHGALAAVSFQACSRTDTRPSAASLSTTSSGKSNFVHSVRVDDDLHRATLSYWDLGTIMLDISDPAQPRYLGRTTPTQRATHSSYLARGGTLLVETHETHSGLPVYYDISQPSQPRQLATFNPPGFEHASVHDPKMDGDTTFFSWYSLGVVAANSANPSQPTLRAQFVPDTQYLNPDYYCTKPCADVWGVALHGDLVLASDMNSGLYIIRLH